MGPFILRTLPVSALSLVLVMASIGCGKSSSPSGPSGTGQRSPISEEAAGDVARHFSAVLANQGLPVDQVGGTSLASPAAIEQAQRRLATEGTLDEGAFSWWFSIKYFDASGAEQPGYFHGSTARMNVEARAHGRLTTAEQRAEIGVGRSLEIQGLLPAATTLEIDGAANDTADCDFQRADGTEERSYHLLSGGRLIDVMKLKDESVNPYPLSGSARWQVAADARVRDANGTAEAHYQATVVVTFNGTRYPVIEIDERYRYRSDLVTGDVTLIDD